MGINMNFTVAVFQRRHMPSYVYETRLMMNSENILSMFFFFFSSFGQFLPHTLNSVLRILTKGKGD